MARIVTIFSDGSVLKPNPGGPGGYAAVILDGLVSKTSPVDEKKILAVRVGQEEASTNQRMELSGGLVGLLGAIDHSGVEVHLISDSEYLIKGLNDWIHNWVRLGWRTSSGTAVKNLELWQALYEVAFKRNLRLHCHHVRGHQGNPWNEYVDRLAGEQSAAMKAFLKTKKEFIDYAKRS